MRCKDRSGCSRLRLRQLGQSIIQEFIPIVGIFCKFESVKAKFSIEIVLSILNLFQSLEYLSRLPSAEQELLVAIKAACDSALKPLIVVLTSGGGLAIDTTQADAIIQAWYCGPQGGTALAEILAGDVNPSAKLPDYVLRLG